MKLARVLLLLVVSTLALVSTDARKETSSLTLSPVSESLLSTRTNSDGTSTSTSTTSTPSTSTTGTAVSATAAPSSSSDSDSSSDEEPARTQPPSSTSAASTDQDTEEDSTAESETTSPATTTPTGAPSINSASGSANSQSSKAEVDSLNSNDSVTGSSGQSGAGLSTILPVILGALACVGALVMAVTYKKKRAAAETDGQRPSSDCEYSDGAGFTPDNRSLGKKKLDDRPQALAASVVAKSDGDLTADFTSGFADAAASDTSMRSTSPFASSRCEARVSSPVDERFACGESETAFSTASLRDQEGSNVVLNIEELHSSSSHGATPQVQL